MAGMLAKFRDQPLDDRITSLIIDMLSDVAATLPADKITLRQMEQLAYPYRVTSAELQKIVARVKY